MYFFRSSNMLSTALLILSVLPLLARGDHKFPWQDMDRMNNMNDTFNGTSHSFNVSMSWSICMRLVYDVPYDPEITDYAPVISNLLQVLHTFGGGAVRLDNGTFPVNSGIDMPSHTCIVGMGPNKTVIQLTPFAPSFYPKKGIIRSRFAERVSLQGITIDGNRHKQAMTAGATYGRDGLSFIHVNYAWLRNVVSRDNHGLGYDFRGSDWRWAFYLILEGSEASHNGDDGVRIHQVFYSGMSNCLLKENGGNGTSIESGSMHTLLQRNQFEYNGAQGRGCGIQINSDAMLTRDVRLVDNHEVSSPQAGVCAHNVAGVSIERNNVTDLVNTKSFCYDVTNTTQFSVSEDSVCFVKSQTSYYPGSTGSLPPPPEFEVFPLPGQNTTMGCEKGIVDRDICCPAKCGECGGLGCGARLSDGQCCYDKIKESGKECGKPPCLLV